jgi:cell division protease FtsH
MRVAVLTDKSLLTRHSWTCWIFKVHLAPLKKVDGYWILAKQTQAFWSWYCNVCNEAALIAARYDKTAVDKQDFLDAVDRIVGGLEKKTKLWLRRKESNRYPWSRTRNRKLDVRACSTTYKVTIVPRGQSLGQHGIYLRSV